MSGTYSNDWRQETQLLLAQNSIYKKLKEDCYNDPSGSHVLALVDEAVHYSYQRTKLIIKHMKEYTLHDGDHLFRVLNLMDRIIPKETLEELSVPELMLLILTAFFHDIGMAPSEDSVMAWRKLFSNETPEETELDEFAAFKKFCSTRGEAVAEIHRFQQIQQFATSDILISHLLTEYIRATHAQRAVDIIQHEWNKIIQYRDVDLTSEFAQLCLSHNQDANVLQDFDTSLLGGPSVFICLPFIGVALRLADIMDFDAKRTPQILFSHLSVRNPISLREWQKHRSVDAWEISNKAIIYQAKCEHPAIEAAIHEFCDIIDGELAVCNTILSRLNDSVRNPFPEHYKFSLPLKINRTKVSAKKTLDGKPIYHFQKTRFTLNKSQVIELLMGTKLYGNPEVALRELLQNSIDACLLRKAIEDSWGSTYEPLITVSFYTKDGQDFLEVKDNGIGMDLDIVNKFYSQIGVSFYKSPEFQELKSAINLNYQPISKFGIGILSCFMVSDSLTVETKRLKGRYESSQPINIIVEGYESIFYVKEGKQLVPGTTTQLLLRENHPWTGWSKEDFLAAIPKIIIHPPVPIEMIAEDSVLLYNSDRFQSLNIDDLKDYNWAKDASIKEYYLDLNSEEYGISGKALVGVLQKRGKPVREINVSSTELTVNFSTYKLDRSLEVDVNQISKRSSSLEVDDEGNVDVQAGTRSIVSSKGVIALHGIEVPMEIFPNFWLSKNQKVKIEWPLSVLFIVDIVGKRDLDLNSSRTEILYTDKWIDFEEHLAFVILSELKKQFNPMNWKALIKILKWKNKSSQFNWAIEKVG